MSGNKNKGKDKGKDIRRAEDYQIITPSIQQHPTKIPVYNKFQPLDNFPALQNHFAPLTSLPLDPILFHLRDVELYYTSFA